MSLSRRGDNGGGARATGDARVGSGLSIEHVLSLALTEIFVALLSLSQINAGKSAGAVLRRGVHAPDPENAHPGVAGCGRTTIPAPSIRCPRGSPRAGPPSPAPGCRSTRSLVFPAAFAPCL